MRIVATNSLRAVLTRIATRGSDWVMNTFSQVIEAFGGRFAQAIGVEESHARTMKARDSIPSTRWLDTVRAAEHLGVEGITLDLLARLDAEKSRQREATP